MKICARSRGQASRQAWRVLAACLLVPLCAGCTALPAWWQQPRPRTAQAEPGSVTEATADAGSAHCARRGASSASSVG